MDRQRVAIPAAPAADRHGSFSKAHGQVVNVNWLTFAFTTCPGFTFMT
jgi:hypothetical protein